MSILDDLFDPDPNACHICGSTDNLTKYPSTSWAADGYSKCQSCIEESNKNRAKDEEARRRQNEMLDWYGSQPE